MDFEEATQQCTQNTQGVVDPRRMGRNNSGLSEGDISDVICILHPCSPSAFKVVAATADRNPHNVLQNDYFENYDDGLTQSLLEEQETFILSTNVPNHAMDLALRFSAKIKNPKIGFAFGRNPDTCDIVLETDTYKRVSNIHFSVFINESGVLMLQDMSTNGTIVDDVVLRGKNTLSPQTRMLNPGSIIQILSPRSDEMVKFIVRIPAREGHVEEYEAKFQAYMRNVEAAEANDKENKILTRRFAAANPKTQNGGASIKQPLIQNQFGMHWSGGDMYNVVGLIGKGAFATVYQLATKNEGQLYAAKELEKRKFMKNGVMDRKLENEMQIMKAVSHKSIVHYIDYHDHANYMYIIMEFVPCGDLQQYLTLHGAFQESLAKQMSAQVLDALAYLHKKKITHRDIKPDNILLANLDPSNFMVKLSDFGLSKVVKDNETFLKTFCGTLLYCAPEVFPHYDAHVAGKGKKRTRQGKAQQASKFHSYSQSVDIWSFGAVLWFSLCVKPPFEGVADNNGRGMFEKIMMTPLDNIDLVNKGVSTEAITLLVSMLNTDPAARPLPAACLRHSWFDGSRLASNARVAADEEGLVAIAEEEEEEAEVDDEPDVSSLSLDDQDESDDKSHTSEVSIHSGSLEILDPRQSKRFKSANHGYRDQEDMIESSPELFYQSIPIAHQPEVSQAFSAKPARKLFGEISQSALESSSVFGRQAPHAVAESRSSEEAASIPETSSGAPEGLQSASGGPIASPSLLGAESMVRELNMDSPNYTNGDNDNDPNEPITPKTPGAERPQSHGNTRVAQEAADEITPRPLQRPMFDRQINIPIPASFYYDADDPSTHNLEYATKISGYDYVGGPSYIAEDTSLPATASGSATEPEDEGEGEGEEEVAELPVLSPPSEFVKPPPRLGKLVSMPGSFTSITLPLGSKISAWGRDPANTHVYPDKYDTRIPKRGISIWFHARDLDKIPDEDHAWLKLPDLHCVISTESSQGILVNGILLNKGEPGKRNFGRIYTGDEIVVLQKSSDGRPGLKFVCEFFHGEGKQTRPRDGPWFKIETESSQQQKSKRKEKEIVN